MSSKKYIQSSSNPSSAGGPNSSYSKQKFFNASKSICTKISFFINENVKETKHKLRMICSKLTDIVTCYKPHLFKGMLLMSILSIIFFIIRTISPDGNIGGKNYKSRKHFDVTDHNDDFSLPALKPKFYSSSIGAYCIPKSRNASSTHRIVDCGEDAYSIVQSEDASSLLLGATFYEFYILVVADGVGGWSYRGGDSSIYAWKLVGCISSTFSSKGHDSNTTPKNLLISCVKSIQEEYQSNYGLFVDVPIALGGSSTAIVLKINCNHSNYCDLLASNLGDSGFVLYELVGGEWIGILKSSEQQHSFNFPFQVAPIASIGDSPANAEEYGKSLNMGSSYLVLVASDGLFDNLFPSDILEILNQYTTNITSSTLNVIAKQISRKSISIGNNNTICSPFCRNAQAAGLDFTGG